MGPRFCKRGNDPAKAAQIAYAAASMGPRFCKRGNSLGYGHWLRRPNTLQWGHAFVSVETTFSSSAFRRSSICFNGATLL